MGHFGVSDERMQLGVHAEHSHSPSPTAYPSLDVIAEGIPGEVA